MEGPKVGGDLLGTPTTVALCTQQPWSWVLSLARLTDG